MNVDGGGVLFSSTEVPANTSTTNFLTHAAFGLHFFNSEKRAVTLATRVPMVVNICIIVLLYILAHLAPVLVSIGQQFQANSPGSTVGQLVAFVAQLFDTLLPGLDFFKVGPTLISDAPPPAGPFWFYIGSVVGYAVLYSAIALLLGLIFFEDRDLA